MTGIRPSYLRQCRTYTVGSLQDPAQATNSTGSLPTDQPTANANDEESRRGERGGQDLVEAVRRRGNDSRRDHGQERPREELQGRDGEDPAGQSRGPGRGLARGA